MNLRDRVADYFRAHPNVWVDGRVLMSIGGAYASRTRISDCRRQLGMTIDNRVRTVKRKDGSKYTVSEYMFVDRDEFQLTA